MDRFVVISGCSGGGKSTLLDRLAREGFAVVEEPGRRIVAEETRGSGSALPWVDLAAFAKRAIAMALEDRARMLATTGWIFFDRGLIDAAVALQHATGEPAVDTLGLAHRYHRRVFLTPPWPGIYCRDGARRHDLGAAIAEYDRLVGSYRRLGYETMILPKTSVEERAELIMGRLSAGRP